MKTANRYVFKRLKFEYNTVQNNTLAAQQACPHTRVFLWLTIHTRVQANRVLSTENARLKKIVSELQTQLLGKPSVRGQSAALMGLRKLVSSEVPLVASTT